MKKKLPILVVLTLCLMSQVSQANVTLFCDDFNSENGGNYQLNYNSFANWNVTDGTVDLIGVGSPWDYFPAYGLFVDMDGSTYDAGKMFTTGPINLQPGTYALSFDLAGNQRADTPETVAVQVEIGLLSKTYSLNRTDPFQTFTEVFTVAAPTNVSLVFEGIGNDRVGMLLDNVCLSVVPAPGAVLLGGLGLGLVGWLRRRKTL